MYGKIEECWDRVLDFPGSKEILCQYWFDNYLLTYYCDLGFE